MWIQSIIMCISVSVVKSWTLPPGEFLNNFATEHDRTSIILYLPQKIPIKWLKNYHFNGSNIIPTYLALPSLIANFSWILTTNEDLHIYVPDDKDEKSMKISIEIFMKIYGMRSNSRREHWLLDISYWTGSQEASNDLAELPTDLDDDLYWYTYSDHESTSLNGNQFNIELFEVYRIHEDMEMTINFYGNWSKADGIKSVKEKKWRRRKNLQVVFSTHERLFKNSRMSKKDNNKDLLLVIILCF